MFLRRVGRKNGTTILKVVENFREGENVVQRGLCTVGVAGNREELESLERVGKAKIIELLNERKPALPGMEEEAHGVEARQGTVQNHAVDLNDIREEKRINVGVEDVFGEIYSQMDFEDLITGTRKDEQWNTLLK